MVMRYFCELREKPILGYNKYRSRHNGRQKKLTKNNNFNNYCKVPWIMDKLLFHTGKCFNS